MKWDQTIARAKPSPRVKIEPSFLLFTESERYHNCIECSLQVRAWISPIENAWLNSSPLQSCLLSPASSLSPNQQAPLWSACAMFLGCEKTIAHQIILHLVCFFQVIVTLKDWSSQIDCKQPSLKTILTRYLPVIFLIILNNESFHFLSNNNIIFSKKRSKKKYIVKQN